MTVTDLVSMDEMLQRLTTASNGEKSRFHKYYPVESNEKKSYDFAFPAYANAK